MTDDGYVYLPRTLLYDPALSDAALKVFMVVEHRARAGSPADVADLMSVGMSRPKALNALAELIERGYIVVTSDDTYRPTRPVESEG